MRTIGIGIVGWGFMGRMHAYALRSIPLCYPRAEFTPRLVGVCTRRADKAREAAETAGFAYATTDFDRLLADPAVEVLSVCTPNDCHEAMVTAALQAGKAVYVDKPLAVDLAQAERIEKAARAAGVPTAVALNNRAMPAMQLAHRLVSEGRLGDILSFQARYLHAGSIDPQRPIGWKQQLQGGVLLDLGSHVLDLVTWLAGPAESVFCTARTLYDRRPTADGGMEEALAEDHALMLLRLPNGALGSVEASKIATGANDDLTLELRGTRGAMRWDAMDPNYLEFYDRTLPDAADGGSKGFTRLECVGRYAQDGPAFPPPKNAVGWTLGHIHSYYTFLHSVVTGVPVENDIACGVRLQRLMEAMKLSCRTKGWVNPDAL